MDFLEDLRGQIKVHIAERCGRSFCDHDLRNLKTGVGQRVKAPGFDSPHAHYLPLTISGRKENEFRELLNLLTINRTYFFRNKPQFVALKEKVLSALIKKKMQKAY